jgi:thymidine phosphorylase
VDGEGQMIASVLSKRLLQVPHVVIDIPIGKTARTEQDAEN